MQLRLLGGALGVFALVAISTIASADDASNQALGAFNSVLPDSALAAQRGGDKRTGTTQVFNGITINGVAENITVREAVTGDNTIGGGSFAGAHGFPMVIQNSGNGVLIQNATIINVTVDP